jgi:hypothetical protein
MTIRQLTQVLNELPHDFADCEVEFGSQLITNRDGAMMWLDKEIAAVYANPDRGDVTLCGSDVAGYLDANEKKRQHLRLIPVFQHGK